MKVASFPSLGRQAVLEDDSERFACKIRLRAERRAGEMLAGMGRASHDRGNQYEAGDQREPQPPSEYAQSKTDAHISDSQAKRWQTLAEVSEQDFEDYIHE